MFDVPEARGVEAVLLAEFGSQSEFRGWFHGYPHWLSVFDNARQLAASVPRAALSPIQTSLTLLAAFLHDVDRCIALLRQACVRACGGTA